MKKAYLLRHAEAGTNLHPEKVAGLSPESPLTDKGRAQALTAGWSLSRLGILPQIGATYASKAVRTQQTLQLATHYSPLAKQETIVTPKLNEMSQGGWEGESRAGTYEQQMEEGLRRDPLNYKSEHPDGGGESRLEVAARMIEWLNELPESESVLAVTHRISITCLLAELQHWPNDLRGSDGFYALAQRIGNASLTELENSGRGWRIKYIGLNLLSPTP